MKQRLGILSLLALVALLVAACGGAAAAPEAASPTEAATTRDDGSTMASDDAESMMSEDPAALAEDDAASMTTGEADEMAKDDAEATMKEDSDATMTGESDAMENDDAGTAMSDDSNPMDKDDGTGSMEAGHQDDVSAASEENMSMDEGAMAELPSWFSAELIDVNSGEALTVADLKGKVVLVETMAIWCSKCLRQQQEVKALHQALGMEDDLVTLVLDIDPNEDATHLRDYAARHGFDWNYTVAPREVAREIGQLYGDQFLNPPSTPMLIVDRHGEVHLLPFGHKTADELRDALAPFLKEGT
jgi:thiol-disulfide isomerase/thioredoxin